MNKLFYTLVLFLFAGQLAAQYCGFSGAAVCSPSGNATRAGFQPTGDALPAFVNGIPTNTALEFKNFDTIGFGGTTLTITSLKIDTCDNLPAGLCWATNKTNNTFANREEGCLTISGTPCGPPGQYKLHLWIHANVGFPISTDADAANMKLYVRLINDGDPTRATDTTQTSARPFITYGNSQNCNVALTANFANATQTACNGSNIILSPTIYGGTRPYTYTWSSTGNSISCPACKNPSATITQNSTFVITVTDATNATVTASTTYNVGATQNQVQFNINSTPISCNSQNNTTTVNVTGGTAPFSVSWGVGGDSTGNSPFTYHYNAQGLYVISVTDANGCITSGLDTVTYTGPTVTLANETQPSCPNQPTGSLSVTVSGGTTPYTYQWSNGTSGAALSNVTSGNYYLHVSDALGCQSYFYHSLTPTSDLGYYVSLSASNPNCSTAGLIVSSVINGTAPYTYNWSGGATTASIAPSGAGTYTVSVTDALGCTTEGHVALSVDCYAGINGVLFNDANNNCTKDAGENGLEGVYIMATGTDGYNYYGTTDINGYYNIQVLGTGLFTLSAPEWGGECGNYVFCGNPSRTISIGTAGDTSSNNNIAFSSTTGFNLGVHPGWSSSNPGFDKDYWVYTYNSSPIPFSGQATVTFNYDANLTYVGSTSNPTPVNNPVTHTLTWNLDSATVNSHWSNRMTVTFNVPQSLSPGYLLYSDFRIDPTTGDCDSIDNYYHFTETVTGSHDPNEKDVFPSGRITEDDSILTYSIHFQNTGTDSTHFIIIKDTLSDNLDASTVRNIAQSHVYNKFEISGKGILTWTFNPLRLVDSATNPAGSKGFVTFSVKKKANLPLSTSITNKATIYFDYNDGVVTNTVADTISQPNGILQIAPKSTMQVSVFPNPFSSVTHFVVSGVEQKFDFELYDVTGRLQKRLSNLQTSQFDISREGLSGGVYLYRLISGGKTGAYGKVVIQ